jgi:molybdopterin converting factor small subunit
VNGLSAKRCGRITIKYYGYLAGIKGREEHIELCESKTVEEVVRLPKDVNINDLIILVNGVSVAKNTIVKPGDTISILPHISGGGSGL